MWRMVAVLMSSITFSSALETAERIIYFSEGDSLCSSVSDKDIKHLRCNQGYSDFDHANLFFEDKGYCGFPVISYVPLELVWYRPTPLTIGKAYECFVDSIQHRKRTLTFQNIFEIVDSARTIRTDRGKKKWYWAVPYALGFGNMGSIESRRGDWIKNGVQKLDSIAQSCKNRKDNKDIISLSNSDLTRFQQLYTTNINGKERKEFLLNFTGRPDADSLGYLYYDTTGFSAFTKPDSSFSGGIIMNRIFYSNVEPWRIVKGLRYRVTDDFKVEILAEKIFLLYQSYYYEGCAC